MQAKRSLTSSRALCGTLVFVATLLAQYESQGADVTFDGSFYNFGGDFQGASLGQEGSWFANFARVGGANDDLAADNAVDALPGYASITFGTTVDSAGGFGGYDTFTLPDGTTGLSGALEGNNSPSTNLIGDPVEFMTLNFSAGVPSSLLLGVVMDNSDSAIYSSQAIEVNGISTGPLTNNRNADVHFFQIDNITSGDSLQIDGVLGSGNNTVNHLGGIVLEPTGSLLTATVDRTLGQTAGNLSITNTTSSPIDIVGYSVTSGGGALDQNGWLTVANGDNPSVDDAVWTILSDPASNTDLSEFDFSGSPDGSIGVGETLDMGDVWIQNPDEQDVAVTIVRSDGGQQPLLVKYTGNGDAPFKRSDLDFDGDIDPDDWGLFKPAYGTDLSSLSQAEAYQAGDLNMSGAINLYDTRLFGEDYDAENGAGAFAALVSGVPEPGSSLLAVCGVLALLGSARRRVA